MKNWTRTLSSEKIIFSLCSILFLALTLASLIDGSALTAIGSLSLSAAPLSMINRAPSTMAAPDSRQRSSANVIVPGAFKSIKTASGALTANNYPIAQAISVTVASAAGVGAVNTRVYVFNEQTSNLGNAVTNNGSGAGSITYGYPDAFTGRVISNMLANARAGVGEIIDGVAHRAEVTASKAADAAALANANAYFVTWNMYGQGVFLNFNMTSDQTRADNDTGIEVIRCEQNLSKATQYSFVATVADTHTLTFYTSPDFAV